MSKYITRQIVSNSFSDRTITRFWNQVRKTDGCWIWTGYSDKDGYGAIRVLDESNSFVRYERVHRFSWILENGLIPKDLCVCHRCDNPPCVRPDHLFLGTNFDNIRDRDVKRRTAMGTTHERVILTEEQVREIAMLYTPWKVTGPMLAKRFGVTVSCITHIVHGRNWKHLNLFKDNY